jgi:hypothetical protein
MTLAIRGTDGVSYPDTTFQTSAPAVTQADMAALQARLAAYDEMYKTRWDTKRVYPGYMAFSNNGLTATRVGPDNNYAHAFSTPCGFFNRIYAEMTVFMPGIGPGNIVVGVGMPWGVALAGAAQYPGSNTWAVGWFDHNVYYYDGSYSTSYLTYTTGETVGIAIDTMSGSWWVRNVSRNTLWNGSTTDNPSNFVRGPTYRQYPGLVIPTSLIFSAYRIGASCVINADGPFKGPVPAGYRCWRGKLPT